jgi:hypothetical protein
MNASRSEVKGGKDHECGVIPVVAAVPEATAANLTNILAGEDCGLTIFGKVADVKAFVLGMPMQVLVTEDTLPDGTRRDLAEHTGRG